MSDKADNVHAENVQVWDEDVIAHLHSENERLEQEVSSLRAENERLTKERDAAQERANYNAEGCAANLKVARSAESRLYELLNAIIAVKKKPDCTHVHIQDCTHENCAFYKLDEAIRRSQALIKEGK